MTAMTYGPTLTTATIGTALVRINTALACLRRRHLTELGDTTIAQAVEDARQLRLHLEQNPNAGTTDALTCCQQLLDEHRAP